MLNKRYLPSITALQCFEAVTRHLSFTRRRRAEPDPERRQ